MESAYEREASAENTKDLVLVGGLSRIPESNQGPESSTSRSRTGPTTLAKHGQNAAVQGAVLAVTVLPISGLLYLSMKCSWLMMLEET